MRLLQKLNRTYILFSSLLFLVAGVLLYFFLTANIDYEAEEQLLNTERRIARQLTRGHTPTKLFPVLEVTQLAVHRPQGLTITDTTMFDQVEGEEETFRQVRSVRNINGHSYAIVLRQMVVQHSEYIMTIGCILVLVMGLLLVCLTLMNRSIHRTVWQSYYTTLEAVKNFSVHQPGPLQLQDSATQEFQEMHTALSRLTEKARLDYLALKEFSENASHEMQTPLAVLQNKLDELLQDLALIELQARHIQTAGTAVQKLSKLNQTLLLLTKIENRQFIHTETVCVTAFLCRQLDLLEDFLLEKKLQVTLEETAALKVSANPALVDVLLSNLLSNAIKHNNAHGCISIEIGKNRLLVSNSGKPLPYAPSLLFERFSKADAYSPSLGLGLAIVRTICHLYGWEVQYQVQKNRHSLEITFPETVA
ncbi:sensor histidine kinase [Rufibacter hautae]|uniref:histidine kinase n=1 Tax=Rufibacter hautae TaxID=2595005 RepID=A0A5B6T855_9BACT|nr:HAMP domain-containing sensor histidine kinase [Rufibacter hautae]KAA3436338.1 HAMP domain-containing histidine kinase [Rufibacter hautae]